MKYSQKKRFVLKIKSDRTAALCLALTLQTLVRCENEQVDNFAKEICDNLKVMNTEQIVEVCRQLLRLSKITTLKPKFKTH